MVYDLSRSFVIFSNFSGSRFLVLTKIYTLPFYIFALPSVLHFSVNRTEIINVICLYSRSSQWRSTKSGNGGEGVGPAIRTRTTRRTCYAKPMRNFSGRGDVGWLSTVWQGGFDNWAKCDRNVCRLKSLRSDAFSLNVIVKEQIMSYCKIVNSLIVYGINKRVIKTNLYLLLMKGPSAGLSDH